MNTHCNACTRHAVCMELKTKRVSSHDLRSLSVLNSLMRNFLLNLVNQSGIETVSKVHIFT